MSDEVMRFVHWLIGPIEKHIHGNGSQKDWTWGCVALDDKDMKELFDAVPVGTKIIIKH